MPQRIGRFTVPLQYAVVAILFAATVAVAFWEYSERGTMWGYPFSLTILFVAFYEEVIFRGFVLNALRKRTSIAISIIVTSILFGLWHFKNLLWMSFNPVVHQVLYTGLIVGPIFAWVTIRTNSIWPAIMLHQLHNVLASPMLKSLFID